jgi:S1-C subfamily serine protease
MMKILLCSLIAVLFVPPSVLGQAGSASEDPESAVFQVVTYDREPDKDGSFRGRGFGTAFFISKDGTALTVSHVAYRAVHDPSKYRLLAVIGKEFYDATVICSSRLPYDPTEPDPNRVGVPPTRDVAEIKLSPSTAFEGRKDTLYFLLKDGSRLEWAKAHVDALPEFPFLAISERLEQHVKVIGFGTISALPLKWTTEGELARTYRGRDGTLLFDVTFRVPPQPGNSGSPVLNDKNEVIGMWAWSSYNEPTKGTGESSAVLMNPCQ